MRPIYIQRAQRQYICLHKSIPNWKKSSKKSRRGHENIFSFHPILPPATFNISTSHSWRCLGEKFRGQNSIEVSGWKNNVVENYGECRYEDPNFPFDFEPNRILLSSEKNENYHCNHIPFNLKLIKNIFIWVDWQGSGWILLGWEMLWLDYCWLKTVRMGKCVHWKN